MRNSITGETIFNANKMTRGVDPRPVLLVESDADQSILAPHIRDAYVRITPGFSKSATLLAAELHSQSGDDWVMALVDKDLGTTSSTGNVVVTSYYDLEAELVFTCGAQMSRVIYSHVVSEATDHETAKVVVELVRRESIALASAIGCMRRHAVRSRLSVSFASLPIKQIAEGGTSESYIEPVALFACLKANASELQAELQAATETDIRAHDVKYVCNGHDLLMAMCVFIGLHAGHRPAHRDFARGLHASVACLDIRRLSVYEPLRNWLLALTGESLWDCAA